MSGLTAPQRRALTLMSEPGVVVHHGGSVFTGTRYRVNGEGPSIPGRTLWAMFDRGLLLHETRDRKDVFSISEAGRTALAATPTAMDAPTTETARDR